jgi:plastocyanin
MLAFSPRNRNVPRPGLVAFVVLLALAAAGCGGAASATGSPAAAPVTASPETTPAATPATVAATLIPYPGPSIPAGTLTLQVVAKQLAFDVSSLSAPARTPFAIHFDNQDAGIGHNVAIRLGLEYIFKPPVTEGVATVDYFIASGLPAGDYKFACTVHPDMIGKLTIH